MMWLLDTNTIKLRYFHSETDVGDYVVLSHTWEDEEVTYQDIESSSVTGKKGYSKIRNTCRLAAENGLKYAWVDTCRFYAMNKNFTRCNRCLRLA